MTTQKKTDGNLKDNAPDGLALSEAEQVAARKEGAKDDVKAAAADTHRFLTDGNLPGDPPEHNYIGADDIMQWEPLLSLGVDEFEKRAASTKEDAIPEEKAAGLLRLERNGQNRTPYVQALLKRLGLKSADLYKVAPGGPDYTNDVTPVTKL
jgi:hypothetical protein